MQLLNLFIYSSTRFYMYKLQVGEALILHNYNSQQRNYVILDGDLLFSKHFRNNKVLSVSLLSRKDIICPNLHSKQASHYFYKIQPLRTTYLFSCSNSSANKLLKTVKSTYNNNRTNYLIEILAHRSIKKRLIHTLLTLTKAYGTISNQKFNIDLSISYDILSCITGGNKNTVRALMQKLNQYNIILYSKDKIIINNIIKLTQY